MEIRKTYTEKAFGQAVALAKAEGYHLLGYTWDYACFNNLLIARYY